MASGFIQHHGREIYLADYANLSLEDFEKEIKRVTEDICTQPLASVFCLNDTSGLIGSPKVIDLFKWSVNRTKPHLAKVAVVGIGFSGARKLLLDAVLKITGQSVTLFDELEKAKDWLAE